jgi:uncharacterized LabA/DUF88 family protein
MNVSALQVVIFLDGGYVRESLKGIQAKKKGDILDRRVGKEDGDKVDYSHLANILLREFSLENCHVELRFYDGIVDKQKEPELYKEQSEYLQRISDLESWKIMLTQITRRADGRLEQKGVDDLITKDMLTGTSENQYDVAILLSGDIDLLEVVRFVKKSGRKVFGAFFPRSISLQLKNTFDKSYEMSLNDFE